MGSSQHPVDRLIREIIQIGRGASSAEVRRILDHIASAPFSTGERRVPGRDRGLGYAGQTLGSRADSLTYHLIKRVVGEEQWVRGTTANEYIADLRRAAHSPDARLLVYFGRNEHFAAVIARTADAVPSSRLGPASEPNVLVVYSADSGTIATGYQFSDVMTLNFPAVMQWLK